MEVTGKTIETTGIIDEENLLQLDEPLQVEGPIPVRVLILLNEEADIEESEWLRAAASNSVFDFLKDPAEDIYSLDDGKPFNDKE
ncbi:MAG: hypothetical protein P9X24_16515 [Candidatus Hatepunaea meridiana]|nr:hypothetical protein [Candidatus Hatepunaea meridiana]